jgi:hypothetical protein
VAGACECDDGYARTAEGSPCEEVPEGLGTACDPQDDACPPDQPFCQPSELDGGYCTSTGCEQDDDCAGGYLCDTRATESYCARPPVGLGKPCTGPADCEGLEASYCVTIMMGGCQVPGCSAPNLGCAPGYTCCDLSSVQMPTLCVPEGVCPF